MARPYVLSKNTGLNFTQLLSTIIIERLLDGITLILFLTFLFYKYGSNIFSEFVGKSELEIILFISIPILLLLVFIFLVLKTNFKNWLVSLLAKYNLKLSQAISKIFEALENGFTMRDYRNILKIIFHSVFTWLFAILVYYFGFLAFSFRALDFENAFVLQIIALVAITVSPTPGAIGLFHLVVISCLTNLFHIERNNAASYAIITYFSQYLVIVVIGLILIFRQGFKFNEILNSENINGSVDNNNLAKANIE